MHTLAIKSDDFTFAVEGISASLNDIFPGFNENDRIGVVAHQDYSAIGVSVLFMAAVTRYYDFHRREMLGNDPEKLRIYPEFFIFHVGKRTGNYAQMDVWPPHREIVVEDDSEQVLEAINDRGITRLLVEDKKPTASTFLRETISSAESRILSTLAYSPDGQVNQADVVVTNNKSAEKFVLKALSDSKKLLAEENNKDLSATGDSLVAEGLLKQTYRRVQLQQAVRMLSNNEKISPTTSNYINTSAPNSSRNLT